jgi:NADH-quinone oxidoreductase subunit G
MTVSKIKIEIDGRQLEVEPGSTIIEAADAHGIVIPRFCYHKKLSVAANCRMCLVDVEKAAKPLPACATPVTDGMKVATRSAKAVGAQKGVMEFLLINHPLDCPICDQGGECELQDLAVGYGGDVSRYHEGKRVIPDQDIGPLIATEMTRCIHCTRCVRFGDEVAGIMELGATGRGEHMRIGTLVMRSVDSELSGNVIDLCPVGALTSKPFRFSARSWELTDRPSISPHDCVGTNLNVQVRRNRVMRVLPRENDDINEVWLADRDRFSYEAVNSDERLLKPMIREKGKWRVTDWNTALNVTVDGIKKVMTSHGAQSIGALASPASTVEEFHLLAKLMRALGSGNVDHRLRISDFSDEADAPLFPYLGLTLREIEALDCALLVGSNVRKDQPLLGLRLRKAFLNGASLFAVNPVDYEFAFDLKARVVTDPAAMSASLARIARELASLTGGSLPAEAAGLAAGKASDAERVMAAGLSGAKHAAVLLGNNSMTHAQASALRALADLIAELSGARFGLIPEANSAGGWLAGCTPHRTANGAAATVMGRNACDMLAKPLKGYLIFGAEPELDCADGHQALIALRQAEFVVAFSAFQSRASEYAHVLLPLAPFTETDGTFVNAEGRFQSFGATVQPAGEARPGWKILRVLGNLFEVQGFDYTTTADVLAELRQGEKPAAHLTSRRFTSPPAIGGLQRIAEVPMYRTDPLVRRAPALQKTKDNTGPVVRMNPQEAQKQGVGASTRVRVIGNGESVTLDFLIDRRVPDGCVLIPAGYAETLPLGVAAGVRVEAA